MSKRRSWKEDLKIFTLAYFKQVRQLVVKAAIWAVSVVVLAGLTTALVVAYDAYTNFKMESQGLVYSWGEWRTPEEAEEAESEMRPKWEELVKGTQKKR